ncbi:MAG: FG-GAP repeat protein, partial [Planctomycetota bacterium]
GAAQSALPQQQLFAPRPVAGSSFGSDLAQMGETLAVRSSGERHPRCPFNGIRGAVHLYRWSGQEWLHDQSLWRPCEGGFEALGRALEFETPDRLLLGIPSDEANGIFAAGAVYTLERRGTRWDLTERIQIQPPAVGFFGAIVKLDGARLVVSAHRRPTVAGLGTVSVFERRFGRWVESARLESEPGDDPFAEFGKEMDARGNLIATAPDGQNVFVYRETGAGWSRVAHIVNPAPCGLCGDSFAERIAVGDDLVMIANPRLSLTAAPGLVYVYRPSPSGTWFLDQTLTSGASSFDGFGSSLALDGDRLLVGAPRGGPGVVIVFERDGAGRWTETERLTPAPPGGGTFVSEFGSTVLAADGAAFVADDSGDGPNGETAGTVYAIPMRRGRTVCDSGGGGVLSASGFATSTGGDVEVRVTQAPPHRWVALFASRGPALPGNDPLGTSLLRPALVGGQVLVADANGTATSLIDLGPSSNASGHVDQTITLQALARGASGTLPSSAVQLSPTD